MSHEFESVHGCALMKLNNVLQHYARGHGVQLHKRSEDGAFYKSELVYLFASAGFTKATWIFIEKCEVKLTGDDGIVINRSAFEGLFSLRD